MHVALFVTVSQGLRFARQTVSVQNRGERRVTRTVLPAGRSPQIRADPAG